MCFKGCEWLVGSEMLIVDIVIYFWVWSYFWVMVEIDGLFNF